jgi:YidC/Oxa1 family membrane protein insertase
LSKAILFLLKFFYSLTGNYGFSIIFLTLVIQFFLFPLSWKSFKASIALRKLQPKIKELQIKYKKEPRRMQAEMMHLYRTYKVNPLGGCLPLIFQIPIFLTLFLVLRNTYALREAPFLLWIVDLSRPDPYYVLPLLMGVSMFVQQRIIGVSTDPSQRMMVYFFPVFLTIIFLNFPAGLVLYWLVSGVISTLIQKILTKKIPS